MIGIEANVELQTQVERLKLEIEQYRTIKDALEEKNTKLQDEVGELKEEKLIMQSSIKQMKGYIDKLECENGQLQNKVEEYKQALELACHCLTTKTGECPGDITDFSFEKCCVDCGFDKVFCWQEHFLKEEL